MKLIISSLLGVGMLLSVPTGVTLTEALAGPDPPGNAYGLRGNQPSPPGNAYGLYGNIPTQTSNQVPTNGATVPIPGTLLLFGAGFGGFAVWNWRQHRKDR